MDPLPQCTVTCPTCFESFTLTGPAPSEIPAVWDYDCEVCCRPMLIHFETDGEAVLAEAQPN